MDNCRPEQCMDRALDLVGRRGFKEKIAFRFFTIKKTQTFNEMIDILSSTKYKTHSAVALFEFMRTRGSTMSSPAAKPYAIIIVALAQCDRMEESFKLIADTSSSSYLPDVSTYKELIEGLCLAGKIEEAYKFLEDMGSN
ncbi:hypothetical protein IFM89_035198 [Coptis chinensis]|uniref:Pentatricopeptide repeat-containing protein n=1 Tax=Coptis chinensis TaxID=261450 RepID=A0A835IHQ2_9MAGN|nr:hypothetical protein IFM89_035198 [Coptis chinensis]